MVEVSRRDAHACLLLAVFIESGTRGKTDVGKCAVLIVPIEDAGG